MNELFVSSPLTFSSFKNHLLLLRKGFLLSLRMALKLEEKMTTHNDGSKRE